MNTEQLKTKEKVLRDSFGWIAERENANLEIKEYHFGEYPDSVQRPKIYQAMQDFASQESKRAVDEFKEKLKESIRNEMNPEIASGHQFYKDPDFLFGCEKCLDLIDKL